MKKKLLQAAALFLLAAAACLSGWYCGGTGRQEPETPAWAKEAVLCRNVLSDMEDVSGNPVLDGLYGGENGNGDARFAVCDLDGNGRMDYLVFCRNRTEAGEETGDIWLGREDGDYERLDMPPALCRSRITAGGREGRFLMLLQSGGAYPWMVFGPEGKRRVYGWRYGGPGRSRKELCEAEVCLREESGDGFACLVTEAILEQGSQQTAWIWVERAPEAITGSRLLVVGSAPMADKNREISLSFWDVNGDGYKDIVYETGRSGGTGGSWSFYQPFTWNGDTCRYEAYAFPPATVLDRENHRVYECYQGGTSDLHYTVYGLKDGQYAPEKELHLEYEYGMDAEGRPLSRARYSEWGGFAEETDISGLTRQEAEALLQEKYPEFTFWREG